jgi:tRNA pseudouridine38-40 synthase
MKAYASIAYDGSLFQGMVSQPGAITVQGELETVISKVLGQPLGVRYNSRTDKGVHAYDQRIEFEAETPIPAQKLPRILNPRLRGIQFNWVREVKQDFSIRKWPHQKEYWYRILWEPPQPFLTPYAWCLTQNSGSEQEFAEILAVFEGEHNFEILSRKDPRRPSMEFKRKIRRLSLDATPGHWVIKCLGDGFLWMMVRNIIAFALACHFGFLSRQDLQSILAGPDVFERPKPSITPAPPGGLYLRQNQPNPEISG